MNARATVMTLVGIGLTLGALASYRRRSHKFAGWRTATGTIVAIETESVPGQATGADSIYHNTRVRFRDQHGADVTADDATHTHKDFVGRQVPLLYDPENPTDVTIAGSRLYVVEWCVLGMGLLCFLIAVATSD